MSAKERALRDRIASRFVRGVESLARDPVVVTAVLEANVTNAETPAEILAKDRKWRQALGADDPLIAPYLTSACAEHLVQVQRTTAGWAEVLAMDDKGCLVAASAKTSDYWQGDEAKWIESFNGGEGKVFVDEIQYDHSSQAYVVQISAPVRDADGRTIGAITVGVRTQQDC